MQIGVDLIDLVKIIKIFPYCASYAFSALKNTLIDGRCGVITEHCVSHQNVSLCFGVDSRMFDNVHFKMLIQIFSIFQCKQSPYPAPNPRYSSELKARQNGHRAQANSKACCECVLVTAASAPHASPQRIGRMLRVQSSACVSPSRFLGVSPLFDRQPEFSDCLKWQY